MLDTESGFLDSSFRGIGRKSNASITYAKLNRMQYYFFLIKYSVENFGGTSGYFFSKRGICKGVIIERLFLLCQALYGTMVFIFFVLPRGLVV